MLKLAGFGSGCNPRSAETCAARYPAWLDASKPCRHSGPQFCESIEPSSQIPVSTSAFDPRGFFDSCLVFVGHARPRNIGRIRRSGLEKIPASQNLRGHSQVGRLAANHGCRCAGIFCGEMERQSPLEPDFSGCYGRLDPRWHGRQLIPTHHGAHSPARKPQDRARLLWPMA